MGVAYNPSIVTSGLVLYLDAGNVKSYPGSGNTWTDLSGRGNHHTLGGNPTYSSGIFTLTTSPQGFVKSGPMNGLSTTNTVVIWYSTTDPKELWVVGNQSGSFYLSASDGNNYYHSNAGSPTNWVDLNPVSNPWTEGYRNGAFHMWEAKNVDFSSWPFYLWFVHPDINSQWQMLGNVSAIMVYNRNISPEESRQNFNALRGRFGI